jgi:hypothetical protein
MNGRTIDANVFATFGPGNACMAAARMAGSNVRG